MKATITNTTQHMLNIAFFLLLSIFSYSSLEADKSLHKIGYSFLTAGSLVGYSESMKRFFSGQSRELKNQISDLHSQINDQSKLIEGKDFDIELKQRTIKDLQHQIEALERQKERELEDLKSDLEDRHSDEITRLADSFKSKTEEKIKIAIELYQEDHYVEIEKLNNKIEILESDLKVVASERDQLIQLKEKLESGLRELEAEKIKFDRYQNEMLDELRKRSNKLDRQELEIIGKEKDQKYQLESARSIISQLKAQNEKQHMIIAGFNGEWKGGTVEAYHIEKISEYLRGYGLNIQFNHCKKSASRIKFLCDASQETKDEAIKIGDNLSRDLYGGSEVLIERKDGYLMIDIPYQSESIQSEKFDPGKVDHDAIEELIEKSNHILISGATGDGKTTLASNLLDLSGYMMHNPSILYLCPKPTATEFSFKGKLIKPDYLDIEAPDGATIPDCGKGLEKIIELLDHRKAVGRKAIENDQPFPKFDPYIVVIDEFPMLLGAFKDQVVQLMLKAPLVGREFNLKLLILGQGATCANWGVKTRDIFMNFSRIYCNSNLDLNVVMSQEIKNLRNAENILARMDKFKHNAKNHHYYGLIIPQQNATGELIYFPQPNYYFAHHTAVARCPRCGSENLQKNGKDGSRQKYRCGDCDHQFRI